MAGNIGRRQFILVAGSAVFGWPQAASSQQSAMPVIGILNSQTRESELPRFDAIRQGLQETGFFEGRNVAIEYRFADGDNGRLPVLAAELVQRNVSIILANSTPPAIAAKAVTGTMPIVFVTGVDPVAVGLVASMNRPGANVTGVTFMVQQLVAKRLELLCDMVPGAAPIGMLAAQSNPNSESDVMNAQAAAAALGRTLHVVKLPVNPDLDSAFAALVAQRVAALFIAPHADFRIWRQPLVTLATRHGLPTSFAASDFVTAGGLMSYGPDQLDSYREAGVYAGRILKGERPAELPVVQATKFEFAINLKAAKALNLSIPPKLLALATQIVE